MRPLYPGGPGFGFPGPSGLDAPHSHGAHDDVTLSMARDLRLFSCYFVVAESLATFVGYRIAQHCIRGCRVYFLSPSQRLWIGFVYCWLKIRLVRCCLLLGELTARLQQTVGKEHEETRVWVDLCRFVSK